MRARQLVTVLGELLVAALIYTAVTLILSDASAESIAWGYVGRYVLGNLVVVAAAGWYVANTDDSWWAVVAITAASLAAAQMLIPRWETTLMAGGGVVGLVVLSAKGVVAGLGGALGIALVFDMLELRFLPPGLPGLYHRPSGYAWRLPALVVAYGASQIIATYLVALILGPTWGHPIFVDLVIAHSACGVVWVGAVALVLLLVDARSPITLGMAAAVVVVPGIVGRYLTLYPMPPIFWVSRVALAALADGVLLWGAAFLLLPRAMRRQPPPPAPPRIG